MRKRVRHTGRSLHQFTHRVWLIQDRIGARRMRQDDMYSAGKVSILERLYKIIPDDSIKRGGPRDDAQRF